MSKPQLPQLSRLAELKSRLLFLIGALIVYRLGVHITVPGIDGQVLALVIEQGQSAGGLMALANLFSGGAIQHLSLFMLGVMPYITASIIVQMLSAVVPSFEQMRKDGQAGRRKMTQYTRYLAVVLAVFQGLGWAFSIQSGSMGYPPNIVINPGTSFVMVAVITWVAGAMFLMWLGEQITERGIGNGISMLIFASIVSGLPAGTASLFEMTRNGTINPLVTILLISLVLGLVVLVVYVERAQRRITINYARRQQGGRMSIGGQSTHLPLKLNMAGVIPAIFASSLLAFLLTAGNLFNFEPIQRYLAQGEPLYVILMATMVVFFCFFYTALVFNSKETADNLKRSGAFIPGIRPGIHTAQYVDKVLTRITLWGAVYITGVVILPEFIGMGLGTRIAFGGTSALIVVVVVMDLIAQIQAQLMSQQYEGLLKKANFTGNLSNQSPGL